MVGRQYLFHPSIILKIDKCQNRNSFARKGACKFRQLWEKWMVFTNRLLYSDSRAEAFVVLL